MKTKSLMILAAGLLLSSCGALNPTETSEPIEESSDDATSEIVTSQDLTSEDATSEEITSAEATSENLTSEALTSAEETSEKLTSEEVTSEDITSEEITSEKSSEEASAPLPLVSAADDHIELTFFADDKTTEITEADCGAEIFISAVPESERYQLKSLSYFYFYGDLGTKYEGNLTIGDDGFAAFTVPAKGRRVSDSGITFIAKELDLEAFDGQDFVGSYVCVDFGSGTTPRQFNQLSSNELTIDAAGTMTFGSKTGYVTEIKEEGLYTENYATLPFGEGMILFNDNSASKLDSPFNHSYDILAVKKENDTDDIESYSVRGERLVLSGNTYYIVSFLKDEVVYKNAFIDATGKIAYFDATFEMIYGDDFMDDKVLYTVTCGDFSLAVSYMGAGGVGSRILAESWFGLYSNGEADLVIINANTAFYNNFIYNVSLNENTLVLTNGVRKLTFTLDLENKAYTFVSDEEDIKTAPNFRGLTFTGVFHDGWDDENPSAVVFDDYESDDAITGTIWYGPVNSTWGHPFTFTATYDLTSNTLAMEITGEIYREGIAGKTTVHAICEDGKMTFTDNLSSYYACDNDVFVCEGFVL